MPSLRAPEVPLEAAQASGQRTHRPSYRVETSIEAIRTFPPLRIEIPIWTLSLDAGAWL